MSEKQDEAKKSDIPPTPRTIIDFAREFLANDAVAIVIKQHLLPDDVENPVVFPPTYLKARVKTQDDEEKKESRKEQQTAVYNLDDLGNGKNVCEIDSPQSDGNRSEVLFKSPAFRHLVPQIEIAVANVTRNLLDAGHRAADALVRFSSLAGDIHDAFERTRNSPADHSLLATLAPTSLLYGAYDSRSTQSKLQRIIKASVRAENVKLIRKSATFIPAVDYVAVNAVKEELDIEGDSNPLSSEGMKHALASQTLGGVRLTDTKLLIRTVKINLAALKQLNAVVDPPKPEKDATEERKRELDDLARKTSELSKIRTDAVQNYILGLALAAATANPDLNLREGCNLRITDSDSWILARHRKDDEPITVEPSRVSTFAEESAKAFFEAMNIDFTNKDRLDEKFEDGVANEFLAMDKKDRDKIRARGPLTREKLEEYKREKKKREKAGDPIEALRKLVDALAVSKKGMFNKAPREKLATRLTEIEGDGESGDDLKVLASKIKPLLTEETGATARKTQMLDFFPSLTTEASTDAPPNAPTESTEEAPQ